MKDTQNILSVNFNVKEFEALLEFHITKAVSDAVAALHLQKSSQKEHVEWITRKEVTEILGISMPTLNNWSKSGIIPGYRIGSLVRYKRSEIDSALKQMKTSNSRKRQV